LRHVSQKSSVGKRPQRASASKAKSSVLSELSGLDNILFNDFIDDQLDSEDVSEQRAFASLPDSVPIEPEEERAAREERERVLFIGTQFSILYTSMYSPAETATQGFRV